MDNPWPESELPYLLRSSATRRPLRSPLRSRARRADWHPMVLCYYVHCAAYEPSPRIHVLCEVDQLDSHAVKFNQHHTSWSPLDTMYHEAVNQACGTRGKVNQFHTDRGLLDTIFREEVNQSYGTRGVNSCEAVYPIAPITNCFLLRTSTRPIGHESHRCPPSRSLNRAKKGD